MNYQEGWSASLVQNYFDRVYRDRGMTKWQGYYLSDHTSALNKEKAAAAITYPPRPVQSLTVIGAQLATAYASNAPVSVQLTAIAPDGALGPDIMGMVRGYTETDVIIGTTELNLETIRNVQMLG